MSEKKFSLAVYINYTLRINMETKSTFIKTLFIYFVQSGTFSLITLGIICLLKA